MINLHTIDQIISFCPVSVKQTAFLLYVYKDCIPRSVVKYAQHTHFIKVDKTSGTYSISLTTAPPSLNIYNTRITGTMITLRNTKLGSKGLP